MIEQLLDWAGAGLFTGRQVSSFQSVLTESQSLLTVGAGAEYSCTRCDRRRRRLLLPSVAVRCSASSLTTVDWKVRVEGPKECRSLGDRGGGMSISIRLKWRSKT